MMHSRMISRRMALLASVAVLGLAACGAPGDGPASSDGGPAVLQLVGGGSGTGAGSEAASMAPAGMDVAGDRMMMPAFIEYVYSGDAPDLTAPAGSWFFPAAAVASTEQVQRLAAAFGVSGDVEQVPADQGGGWRVGSADWTGPSVQVVSDGMLSWWFNPGPGEASTAVGCAIAVDPAVMDPAVVDTVPGDTVATDAVADTLPADSVPTDIGAVAPPDVSTVDCVEPAPPVNVPDAATAEAKARDLFSALGVEASSYEFETVADEWGVYVTGYLLLDGVRTWQSVNVGFGAEGAITWAGGVLADPQRGDDYPRIGVEAAVARLNDQSSMWMYPMARGDVGLAASSGGAADAAVAAPMPLDTAPVDPVPVDTTPIVVTLTDASPSLEMFWAADGTVWLLPGYRFATSDGGTVSVLAVPDEFIEQTAPTVDTVPVDTVPVDTVPVDTVPVDTTPVETVPVEATGPLTLDEAATLVVGLPEADALAAAEAAGVVLRVLRIDGVDQAATDDFRVERYNVAVDGGVVTAVLSNG